MKPYLTVFLLFLLVNQFLLATAFPWDAVGKGISKGLRRFGRKEFMDKTLNYLKNITQNSSPPQPNAPLKKTQGLHLIKDYLYNYGYIQSSGQFNDYWDQETISAIKSYQKYFNLQVTGELSNQTVQLMSFLRCGVPDINFSYNFTDNVSWPKAGDKWFPDGNLTYGFLPESQIPDNMTKVFRGSFTRWAQASRVLNLTEATYDNADIKVGAYNFTLLGFEDEVFGASLIVLQPPSNVTNGFVLLDATNLLWALPIENDSLSWQDGILDLETVVMHQIGHLLGLDHSSMNDSVMYPYILPSQQRKVQLSDSDKSNIQQQHSNGNSGLGGRWGMLSVTIFSLGFAYVLLF